eukprot:3277751-Alexandrium_andersonii.AAC.1
MRKCLNVARACTGASFPAWAGGRPGHSGHKKEASRRQAGPIGGGRAERPCSPRASTPRPREILRCA